MDSFPDASSIPPFDEDILDTATIVPSEIEWPPDPQVITDFLTVIRVNLSAPCPLGFVCDETRQANCTKIRIVSIGYGFGDVHAGGWCPEGLDGLQLCPVGHYCPTAEELILCPEGYFCPDKTAIPEILCGSCLAGAEQLTREWYGYLLIIFMFLSMLVWILFGVVRKYRSDLVSRFVDLSSRSIDTARSLYRRNQRVKELERLKPKLFAIQKRLEQVKNVETSTMPISSSLRNTSTPLSIQDSGRIHYNAGALFDTLDKDHNKKLDFEELQRVMELKPEQLEAFVKRMNELAGNEMSSTSISRPVFVKYFLRVLEETSHFGPTTLEVEELFQELSQGEDWVAYSDFFHSRLAVFLSDPQINELIAKFRKCVASDEVSYNKRKSVDRSQQRSHGFQEQSTDGSNAPYIESQSKTSQQFNGQIGPRRTQSNRFSMRNMFAGQEVKRLIHRDMFCRYYAELLARVTEEATPEAQEENTRQMENGVDLAFEDLSLEVAVGDNKVNVVNQVSGRLPARTMTALMGGSGAGKTSLLNALCGRAFYGTTKGTIRINGHVTTIEEHKSCTGFVPQDDIVHAELTVRENLIYSGRFSLPKGTTPAEIEDYADTILAYLGLSRVADSIVGDVNRRGVSGGEKKRVNIGVELMSKPSILFLDEPTSGLDSSSALLVMGSLKKLVENQGVTVLSVIHQPRKAIFDSFDSLILLGVGGNMVYHGPVPNAQKYFAHLPAPYLLPHGESLADWLIDVSSGRLATTDSSISSVTSDEEGNGNDTDTVDGAISSRGPSTAKFEHCLESAKERRQVLYECWSAYFKTRSPEELARYTPPEPYDLPRVVEKPSFWAQLVGQIERNLLILWRNRTSKLVDTTMIVGAVVLIALLQGVTEVTRPQQPGLSFDQLVEGDPYEIPKTFPNLFRYAFGATTTAVEFALKIGVITSVLLGLTAAKALTAKRLEFFRESGSGWDVNAYFLALNVTSTLEHLVQMVLAAGCAYWIRDSLTPWYTFQIQFLMLMWTTVSWSLLIPLLVPANNTVLAVGFFMAFFGLLFSGGIDPVTYTGIYEDGNGVMALFSGIFSVTRFFIESMTVQEQRCLPAQSGFTIDPSSVNFPIDIVGSFHLIGLAQNDLSVVQRSCNGWYWGVLPAFLVGISLRVLAAGVLHVSDRSRQNKKSLWIDLKKRPLSQNKEFKVVASFVVLVLVLFAVTSWAILTTMGETGILQAPGTEEQALALANTTIDSILPGSALPSGLNLTTSGLNLTNVTGGE